MTYAARPGDTAGRIASGLLITLGLIAGTASANVEVGGIAGAHVFSDTSELGATDGPDAPSQRSSALLGVRVGAFLADLVGIEAEFGVIPTVARETEFGVVDLTYRAHLVFQFRGHDPANVAVPFLLAGAGAFSVVSSSNEAFANDPLRDIAPDTDVALYFGTGLKLRLGASAGVRFDVRALVMPSSENTVPADPDSTAQTVDFEALASAYFEIGRAPKVVTVVKPPPREEPDPDGDAIRGAADQCPTDAEDKDGFQDDDGCPDLDNDFDGLADATDACPVVAEDKDSYQDDDGCPDPDNDADGIPDAADRCPSEPEDKDGFQDDDGCPDPDNDGDGVADAADACIDKLETKNGFEDTDGCPDEVPATLKPLDGVVANLAFKQFAATFQGSTKSLDAIAELLKANPELKIEVSVHTDDEVVTRGLYADNQELSQARADAVLAHLVKKGVEIQHLVGKGYGDSRPTVSPEGLTGAKLTAVRKLNRRVEIHLVSPLSAP